jgi:hypothetical protein
VAQGGEAQVVEGGFLDLEFDWFFHLLVIGRLGLFLSQVAGLVIARESRGHE